MASSLGLERAVAYRYFIDGQSKVQIAKEMGISRFKVARILEHSLNDGLVTVKVQRSTSQASELAAQLRKRLNLRDCTVVDSGTWGNARQYVAAIGGAYLTTELTPTDIVGFSWGRTLAAMTNGLSYLPPIKAVQINGSVGNDLPISPFEVLRNILMISGGPAETIVAPLMAENAKAAETIRNQTDVKRTFSCFSDLSVAILSVGSWQPQTSQLVNYLTVDERAELEHQKVVGEIAGIFLDKGGQVLNTSVRERMIGINDSQLRAVETKIILADGSAKAATILAAIRSRLANVLITDITLAEQLQQLLRH